MRQLYMTNDNNNWIHEGDFDSATAAAKRIHEIEGYSVSGLFLEICTTNGIDAEAFAHLEHKGRRAIYAGRRRVN